MFVIGFDFGIKYIGVAIGQKITKTASPLTSIFVTKKSEKWKAVFGCIDMWSPSSIVVGYPYSDIFRNDFFLKELDAFINVLNKRYNIRIFVVDESLSTWEAKKCIFFRSYKEKNYFLNVNAVAASILLEQWFSDIEFKNLLK